MAPWEVRLMTRWMRFVSPLVSLPLTLSKKLFRREVGGKLVLGLSLLLVGAAAFFIGRTIGLSKADADQIPPRPGMNSGPYSDDYSGRVVAYIYNREPISRAELAEFLIERFGVER